MNTNLNLPEYTAIQIAKKTPIPLPTFSDPFSASLETMREMPDIPMSDETKRAITGFQGWKNSSTGSHRSERSTTRTPATRLSGDRQSWKNQMQAAYERAGCNSQFARMLVGLDALESRWGEAIVGNYNYGNIKYTGLGSYKEAKDDEPGLSKFRNYDSVDDYVQNKLSLLKRRYDMTGNETEEEFISKLSGNNSSKYRYATSSNYGNSLRGVLRTMRFGGVLERINTILYGGK